MRSVLCALCFAASAASRLAAQRAADGSGRGLTLRAALDSARRNNADLLIARRIADSAAAEGRIAHALPNPVFTTIPNVPYQYAATIPIDVGPQRWSRVRAGALAAQASGDDVRDSERLLELRVAHAWYDVLLADAKRSVAEQRREVVRQLVAADSVRVHAGDLPERALARSRVELLRTDGEAARNGLEAQSARLMLQELMGARTRDTALTLEGSLAYRRVSTDDSGAVAAAALLRRPDIAAARRREEQSGALERLAKASLLPVPQLSYVRQFGAPFETGRYGAFGVGVEIPLLNQYRGQRDRAAAGRETATLVRARLEAQALREVTTALAEVGVERALVERYESGVLGAVEENVQATRYAYSRRAASLLELLDALRAQQDIMTDYSTALHDYWIAVQALRTASGLPPIAP